MTRRFRTDLSPIEQTPAGSQDPQQSQQPQPEPIRADKTQLGGRLSLSQMTTRRWSLIKDVESCCTLGLKHIGLWRLKYEDYRLERVAAILREYGLRPSSVSWIGGFTCANGYLLDDTIEESLGVIEFASRVRAENIVVATGEQGKHIFSHASRLSVDALHELGDVAAGKGIDLAVMPMSPGSAHGWTFLNSLRKTEDFLEKCDHPSVGLCLNSYHILQSQHWKDELSRLIDSIKLVRLCDGRSPRRPKSQCLPLQGKMPIRQMVDHLESQGYCGKYEIDTWSDDVWKTTSLDPFQQCVSQLRKQFPFLSAG